MDVDVHKLKLTYLQHFWLRLVRNIFRVHMFAAQFHFKCEGFLKQMFFFFYCTAGEGFLTQNLAFMHILSKSSTKLLALASGALSKPSKYAFF